MKILRVTLMSVAGGVMLLAFLGAFGGGLGMMGALIGGVITMLLAAIAK